MPTPEIVARLHHLDPALVGERLRHARVAAGLGQMDVAKAVGISISYVSRIESGKRRCDIRLLERFADACSVSVESLLGPDPATAVATSYPDLEFAAVALEMGDATTALTHLDALTGGDDLVPPSVQVRAGLLRGRALERLGRVGEAVEVLETLDVDAASTAQWVEQSLALSRVYRDIGDVQRSIQVGEQALRRLDDRSLAGSDEAVQLTVTVASAYFEQGDRAYALRMCRRSLEAAEAAGSPRARASAYWNCAIMELEQGQADSAITMARRALALLGESTDQRNIARLRGELGAMELQAEPPDLDQAERTLELARQQLRESSAGLVDIWRTEVYLARVDLMRGEHQRALLSALEAATALEEASPQLTADSFVVAGEAALGLNDLDQARAHLLRAVLVLSGVGDDRTVAQLWMDLGEQLRRAGQHEEASDAFQRAAACAGVLAHRGARQAERA